MTDAPKIRTHDLWIGDKVLSIGLAPKLGHFPADPEQIENLNQMVCDLARAAKGVLYHAENGEGEVEFLVQPVEAIADAIILLTQLSEAVRATASHAAREVTP